MIAYARLKLRALFHALRDPKAMAAAAALALSVSGPALALTLAQTDWKTQDLPRPLAQIFDHRPDATPKAKAVVGWEGRDLDGDGAPDIINPTGHAPRTHDAYGDGAFGASRDGGAREHEGVDYVADAGQAVVAPISGFVSKIGFAYPGDTVLKFVEIDNPALNISARVFYVDAQVAVGQAVRLGTPIGRSHSLQKKYPGGMTDHVHLEVAEAGRRVDATTLIHPRLG